MPGTAPAFTSTEPRGALVEAKSLSPGVRHPPPWAHELLAECESALGETSDPARAGRLHYEAARVLESAFGDDQRARVHYEMAVELRPEHLPTVHGALRLLVKLGAWDAALPLFGAEVRLWADPGRKARLWHEKGQVLERRLGLPIAAREAYEAALALEPGHPSWLRAVLRRTLLDGDWVAADRVLEQAANARPGDAAELSSLLALRARIQEKYLCHAELATDLYRRAAELDPRAPGVLRALRQLYHTQARWRDLGWLLELEAQAVSEPRARALLLARAARVHDRRLGDLGAAISLLERAIAQAPDEVLLLEELASLLTRAERFGELRGVLEHLVECAQDPAERAARAYRVGRLLEFDSGDEPAAIQWYQRVLDHAPTHAAALRALAGLHARRAEWEALVGVLRREAESTGDVERRAEVLVRIGDLLENQLKDGEAAALEYSNALALAPHHPVAFRQLLRLYAAARRHPELLELLERAVDGAPDVQTRVTYLMRIAELEEEALEAPERAVHTYQRVIEISPGHLGAIQALQRAAERAGKYRELVAALELEVEQLVDAPRRVPLLARAGELLVEQLNDCEAALCCWRRALDIEPRHRPTLRLVVRWLAQIGRWEELLEMQLKLATALGAKPEAVGLLLEAGELCETKLGEAEKARRCYRRALRLEPRSIPALHALQRLGAARSDWEELARLVEAELAGAKHPASAGLLALRLGELYEERLASPQRALDAYERALSLQPDLKSALDGRERLLENAGQWERLGDALAREGAQAGDAVLAVDALLATAELWRDDLHDPSRAAEFFQAALARDPTHLGALFALEWMGHQLGDSARLVAAVSSQARVLGAVPGRAAAWRELVALKESQGNAGGEELERLLTAVLDLAPTDVEALECLARLALERGDGSLLAHVDAKLGALAGDPGLAAAHVGRFAAALEEREDPAALNSYRSALGQDPHALWSVRGFTRLATKLRDPALLEEAAGYEAQLGHDRSAAARLLVSAAASADDAATTIACLERALEHDPANGPALAALRAVLTEQGETLRLLDDVTQAAKRAADPEAGAKLWLTVAELYAEERRDTGAGLAAIARALGQFPDFVPAMFYGATLLERSGQYAAAVDRLECVTQVSSSRETVVRAHLELSRVCGECQGDLERALAELRAVLELEPTERTALAASAELYAKMSRVDEAIQAVRALVEASTGVDERARHLVKLGRLEQERGQTEAAVQAYEQAVGLTGCGPGSEAAGELKALLAELGERGNPQWQRYIAALGRYAQQFGPGHPEWHGLMLETARVLADQAGHLDAALGTLEHAITLAPDQLELRLEYGSRLLAAKRWLEAADQFRAVVDWDARSSEAWRGLVSAWRASDRVYQSARAVAPLVWMGIATEEERAFWQAQEQRPAGATAGSFDAAAWHMVAPGIDAEPGLDLLASMREFLGQLYPPELDRYQVSHRDRIGPRTVRPVRQLADRVAAIFGHVEFDLYLYPGEMRASGLELTDPPSILLPAQVAQLAEGQQVFVFAHVLALMSRGLGALERLTPAALGLLLAALARTIEPDYGVGQYDEQELAQLQRRLGRVLSWRSRRMVEDAARRYTAAPPRPASDLIALGRIAAARAALVVSDSLPGAALLVRRYEGDLSDRDASSVASRSALLADLLSYWVSDAAFVLRHRLGMDG